MEYLISFARRFQGFLAFAALIFLGLIFFASYLFSAGSFDQLLSGFGSISPTQFLYLVYTVLGLPFIIILLLILLTFMTERANLRTQRPQSGLIYVVVSEYEDKTKGIADAEVRLILPDPKMTRTDPTGGARFAFPAEFTGKKYLINASKSGYQTGKEKRVKMKHTETVHIYLKRKPQSPELPNNIPQVGSPSHPTQHVRASALEDRATPVLPPPDSVKSSTSLLEHIDQTQIPPRLKALIDSGARFIDVPPSQFYQKLIPKNSNDYLYCELRMRQTSATFVFRALNSMKIEDAAEYLVEKILPHLRAENYDWSFVHDNEIVPLHHTFVTANIKSGNTVYLMGNHREPKWAPKRA